MFLIWICVALVISFIIFLIISVYKEYRKEFLENYNLCKLHNYTEDTLVIMQGINRDISLDYLQGIQYEVLYSEDHKNYIIGIRHIKIPKKLYYIFLNRSCFKNDYKNELKVSDSLEDLGYYLDKIKNLDEIYKDIEDIKIVINKAIIKETLKIKEIEDYNNKVLEKKYKTVDIIYPDKEHK